MRVLQETPEAERDVVGILRWSRRQFGAEIARRYRLLIEQAYRDLQASPDRPTASPVQGSNELWRYRIALSRLHVEASERIGAPRHLVFYRYDDHRVEIVRILHDSMDLERHLPGRTR